jgi:hypothetical protein
VKVIGKHFHDSQVGSSFWELKILGCFKYLDKGFEAFIKTIGKFLKTIAIKWDCIPNKYLSHKLWPFES